MISNSFPTVNPIPLATVKGIVKSVMNLAPSEGGYVAFDADGTLWHRDASELFFDHLITTASVPLPKDPKAHYQKLKAQDPKIAYTWLAQILEGLSVEKVRSWSEDVFRQTPLQVFSDVLDLITRFHTRGLEVWVVTASVKWVVEAGVSLYGLPVTGVLGVTTQVQNGLITTTPLPPVTWREGKAEALRAQHKGKPPLFAAGNTLGDLAMMEISQTQPLALLSHQGDSRLALEERQLQELAQTNNWLAHSF